MWQLKKVVIETFGNKKIFKVTETLTKEKFIVIKKQW
jgi:hypothetical protein